MALIGPEKDLLNRQPMPRQDPSQRRTGPQAAQTFTKRLVQVQPGFAHGPNDCAVCGLGPTAGPGPMPVGPAKDLDDPEPPARARAAATRIVFLAFAHDQTISTNALPRSSLVRNGDEGCN